jgi:hypothetical protein
MPHFHIFIISWSGFHDSALNIAASFSDAKCKITIVYSDSNPDFSLKSNVNSILRPNALYWADKFKACIDFFDEEIMLIIHADCKCEDWMSLFQQCQLAMKSKIIGAWAPKITNTPWHINKTKLGLLTINKNKLRITAQTDAIIFALSLPVIERMREFNYDNNTYGWGIDQAFIAYLYAHSLIAVVDESVEVEHNEVCGYAGDKQIAKKQMIEFLKQMTLPESIQHVMLNATIKLKSTRKI